MLNTGPQNVGADMKIADQWQLHAGRHASAQRGQLAGRIVRALSVLDCLNLRLEGRLVDFPAWRTQDIHRRADGGFGKGSLDLRRGHTDTQG